MHSKCLVIILNVCKGQVDSLLHCKTMGDMYNLQLNKDVNSDYRQMLHNLKKNLNLKESES